jgi:hypothetical protein
MRINTVEAEESPSHWIPQTVEEVMDGAAKIVPILNSNALGAGLLIALTVVSTVCAIAIISTARNPQPLQKLRVSQASGQLTQVL